MRVPDAIKDGAYFLCVEVAAERGTYLHFIGTAFFIEVPSKHGKHDYLVTARHVIQEAKRQGHRTIYLRLNRRDGGSRVISLSNEWVMPDNPAIDVCVLHFPTTFEFLVDVWFRPVPSDMILTKEVIDDYWVGVGDELVISGLFNKHWGEEKNVTVLRSGRIAAMPEVPFEEVLGESTRKEKKYKYDAYLAEMKSVGGLSGSPAYLFLEPWRFPLAKIIDLKNLEWRFYLLGLVRARWDLKRQDQAQTPAEHKSRKRKTMTDEEGEMDRLNTGIAQLTPIGEAMALINGEKLTKQREEADMRSDQEKRPK